jgi:hypothetical protein
MMTAVTAERLSPGTSQASATPDRFALAGALVRLALDPCPYGLVFEAVEPRGEREVEAGGGPLAFIDLLPYVCTENDWRL